MSEIAAMSWFGADGQRVSVYKDGTVEIQWDKHSYRATPHLWVRAAIELNGSVSHYRADLIPEGRESPSQNSSRERT